MPSDPAKLPKSERLRALLPDIWELVRPRRGLLAFGMLLMAINRVSGLVLPASTKYLVDDIIGKRHYYLLVPLILAVVGATVIQGVTSFGLTQLLSKAAQRLIAELRRKVQEHVGRLPVSYYDSNKSGMLVSRIMSDVEGVRNLIGTGLVEFVGGLLTAVLALGVLLRISAPMTGVALGAIVVFGLALRKAFGVMRPIFRERGKINAEVTGRLTESLGGVRVVKGYHAEAAEAEVFAGGVQRLLDNVMKTLTSTSLMSFGATLMMGILSALVMYLGARQMMARHPDAGPVLHLHHVPGVSDRRRFSRSWASARRSPKRWPDWSARAKCCASGPRTKTRAGRSAPGAFRAKWFSTTSPSLTKKARPVLHDVSFRSAPDTVTALVGASGSGKSTIIGLIAAFYTPREGVISVDGVDLATVRLDSYRTQLGRGAAGYISCSTAPFARTWPSRARTPPKSKSGEACRIARVDEFAESFEKSYDTVVGERGVKLSGGQRQRVSIARAILADPAILILDEATSSLDSESEALIQEGLSYLMKGRTTFVIAHRLSTIRRADQILVVEGGRIVERGRHESLYALRGRYYDLYTRQHGVQTNLFLAPGEGEQPALEEEAAAAGARAAAGNPLSNAVRLIRG